MDSRDSWEVLKSVPLLHLCQSINVDFNYSIAVNEVNAISGGHLAYPSDTRNPVSFQFNKLRLQHSSGDFLQCCTVLI